MRQNGVTRQNADLSLLIWSVPELIAHLSQFYHLRPGDLIFTGTPAGVGPVKPGDVLEGTIEGAGELKITIGAGRMRHGHAIAVGHPHDACRQPDPAAGTAGLHPRETVGQAL